MPDQYTINRMALSKTIFIWWTLNFGSHKNNVRPSLSDDDHLPSLHNVDDGCGDDYRDHFGLQRPLHSKDRRRKKEVQGWEVKEHFLK